MLTNLITVIADCQINTDKLKKLFIDPYQAFKCLTNKDTITPEDVRSFMDATDEEIDFILQFLDFNRDHRVTYTDFANALKPPDAFHVRQALLQLLRQVAINYNKIQLLKELEDVDPVVMFNQLDQQNRGYITERSVAKSTSIPECKIKAFFRALDKDHDGRIYLSEFMQQCRIATQKLTTKYRELKRSQEKERRILQKSLKLQEKVTDEQNSKLRLRQIHQCLQSRLNLERAVGQKHYDSLLTVRSQIMQVDYIRRQTQRDAFERLLKHEHSLLHDLKITNQQTAQKYKNLSSMHDQLYTIRTQQDLSEKRLREMSLHSQI